MSKSIVAATGDKRSVSEIWIRDETNTPRMVTEIWVRDENNVPRQTWGGLSGGGAEPLTASADPTYVAGAASSPGSRQVTTNQTTVTVTGGVAPYTYSWSGDGGMTATNPTSATTAFSAIVSGGNEASSDFICTVTDALGKTVASNIVSANVSNYGKSSGNIQ